MPNSRSCDEFSVEEFQRLQIVLFTLRDPKTNAVTTTTADVQHVPRVLDVLAKEWVLLNAEAARDPELTRMHREISSGPTHCLHCLRVLRTYVGQGTVGDDKLASTTATR